jgi:nitroreductase
MSNPVLNAIRERRSVRKYTDEPVSPEQVRTILEAGRWAPSGKNNQPWRFIVLYRGDERQAPMATMTHYGKIVDAAACLVVVLIDRHVVYSPMKDHQGAGACIQNMLLAVHSLGLGAVWLGEIVNQADQVLDLLRLSGDDYELMAVLAIGHPAATGSSSRKELTELVLEGL